MDFSLTKFTDEELVSLYVETQQNMYFEEIYNRYSDKVFRKCMSFVKSTAKAEDCTHDIFFKLILKIGSFKQTAKFSTWLYSITYNFCMDQIRVAKKKSEVALEGNFDLAYEEDDKEFETIRGQGLKKSLESVSIDEKALVLMKYQDNFSIREISEALNITESAVKMRLMRSKEKIRKVYLENVALFLMFVLNLFR